jgi:hypothetical protein
MPANRVELSAFAVVQQLGERRLVHLAQHVAELLVVAAALGEVVIIGFPERASAYRRARPMDAAISATANRAFMI